MKHLILCLSVLMLTACGGSGGGSGDGGSTPHVPDNTPHDYGTTVSALTNTAMAHPVTIHQVCAFGFPGLRDETANYDLNDTNGISGGVGCGAVENYTVDVSNTGTDVVYVSISIDGVLQPDVIVQPGTTYNFQRGF